MNNFIQNNSEIKQLAVDAGFVAAGIVAVEDFADLAVADQHLKSWLNDDFHGEMRYLADNPGQRLNPKLVMPEVKSVICCLLPYAPQRTGVGSARAEIAAFAQGRDYHKLVRKALKALVQRLQKRYGGFNYRFFCDSSKVFEKVLAARAGLGWIGKNTLLLNKQGSYFVLGEIFTDLPLVSDDSISEGHCGNCQKCINHCPTKALAVPFTLDARRCIAYLTIEYKGIIPEELRPALGTKIFGCDICQQVCPWNKDVQGKIKEKPGFLTLPLHRLMLWSEKQFLAETVGFALRRVGYECFLRNVAVALGNSPKTAANLKALQYQRNHAAFLVREHVRWALARF